MQNLNLISALEEMEELHDQRSEPEMSRDKNLNAAQHISKADITKAETFAAERNTSILVTFFDDIEGSAIMKQQMKEEAFQRLRKEHDDLLTSIVSRGNNGMIIKSTGDGLLAMFFEPSTAVECAIEIQERLYDHPNIKVRIGMDMGQVRIESAGGVQVDMFGRHVDWAARAMTMADAGHILVTHSVYDDAFHWLSDKRIEWKEHGSYRLKPGEPTLEIYEPYTPVITQPMISLRGLKVGNGFKVAQSTEAGLRFLEQDLIELSEGIVMLFLMLTAGSTGPIKIATESIIRRIDKRFGLRCLDIVKSAAKPTIHSPGLKSLIKGYVDVTIACRAEIENKINENAGNIFFIATLISCYEAISEGMPTTSEADLQTMESIFRRFLVSVCNAASRLGWRCPDISEIENMDFRAIQTAFELLKASLNKVGLS